MDKVAFSRRRVLRASLAAGSLFLPLPWAWSAAQSDGALTLLRLPKLALVVGNGEYRRAPLKNPANDAKAIGDALKELGFAVTTMLDATRAEMVAAVQAYVRELEAKKCVGLFYYAGHGVQLDWKNYMLPVDAEMDTVEDVQKQAVEVNSLIQGLVKASNPLNIIILDACRDNPFGTAKRPPQKGLSQMDAPTRTILAYATSPGNVASDGDGMNGLYTENLLREIKVAEAKIEDVFKRVRLGVRRKSNGAQIPWESTSLEEDFWFLPPAQLKKLSDEERERLFQEELLLWEKVQSVTVPGPLEEYLRLYPNGNFSEVAQLRLDRLLAAQGEKKLRAPSQEGNPFTKGSAEADTNFAVGDSYTNRVSDLFTGIEQSTFTMTVVQITESEVLFDSGVTIDLLGNVRRTRRGERFSPRQQYPLEYIVGKRWTTRFESTNPQGATGTSVLDLNIAGRERITVPAGTFDAFRIEGFGYTTGLPVGPVEMRPKWWMAPDQVRWPIRAEDNRKVAGKQRILAATRTDLVSFRQA
jgi:hypothetical protein